MTIHGEDPFWFTYSNVMSIKCLKYEIPTTSTCFSVSTVHQWQLELCQPPRCISDCPLNSVFLSVMNLRKLGGRGDSAGNGDYITAACLLIAVAWRSGEVVLRSSMKTQIVCLSWLTVENRWCISWIKRMNMIIVGTGWWRRWIPVWFKKSQWHWFPTLSCFWAKLSL